MDDPPPTRDHSIGLVAPQGVGGGARPARSFAVDLQLCQQFWQRRGVTGLAGSDDHDQRQTAAVDQRVGLGRPAPTGPSDAVIVRFVPPSVRILVVR